MYAAAVEMAKLASIIYGLGLIPSTALTYGTFRMFVNSIDGMYPYKPADIILNPAEVSFSCLPMGLLLLTSALVEWKSKSVDGRLFFIVLLSIISLVLVAITAHQEKYNFWFGVTNIFLCATGIIIGAKKLHGSWAARP